MRMAAWGRSLSLGVVAVIVLSFLGSDPNVCEDLAYVSTTKTGGRVEFKSINNANLCKAYYNQHCWPTKIHLYMGARYQDMHDKWSPHWFHQIIKRNIVFVCTGGAPSHNLQSASRRSHSGHQRQQRKWQVAKTLLKQTPPKLAKVWVAKAQSLRVKGPAWRLGHSGQPFGFDDLPGAGGVRP